MQVAQAGLQHVPLTRFNEDMQEVQVVLPAPEQVEQEESHEAQRPEFAGVIYFPTAQGHGLLGKGNPVVIPQKEKEGTEVSVANVMVMSRKPTDWTLEAFPKWFSILNVKVLAEWGTVKEIVMGSRS